MYGTYNGVKSSLTSGDITAIRGVYSNGNARSKDHFEGAGGNETINDPTNINSELKQSTDGLVENDMDITTTSDVDFFKMRLQAWTGSTMTVKVQSTGLSLLAPKLTIYAEDKVTVLGTATGTSGSTISLTVNGVGNNHLFYFKVQGADSTAFGTGAYALTVDCGSSAATPTITFPNTTLANGSPLTAGNATPDSLPTDGDVSIPTIAVASSNCKPTGVSGTASACTVVTVTDNGNDVGITVADAAGNWSYTLPSDISSGIHLFGADADGLESSLVTLVIRRRKH